MKKLFYLEYNSVKRFESTYGTLPDQLPPGAFLHSLSDFKVNFYDRTLFGQDMAEMVDNKSCKVGGKDMSVGQYLVQQGLIREDELSDAVNLNVNYYQKINSLLQEFHTDAATLYDPKGGLNSECLHSYKAYMSQLNTRRHYDIKGPKLTFGEERKYWIDAISKGDKSLTGGRVAENFRMDHLNTYSSEGLKEIREIRKNEAELIKRYEDTVKERSLVLKNRMRGYLGPEVSDELLDRMIFFHPAMMTDVKTDEIPEKDNEYFISLIKDFAGSDVPEEERRDKRSEAYNKMIAQMWQTMGPGFSVTKPDDLIDNKTYTDRNKGISYGSKLRGGIVGVREP